MGGKRRGERKRPQVGGGDPRRHHPPAVHQIEEVAAAHPDDQGDHLRRTTADGVGQPSPDQHSEDDPRGAGGGEEQRRRPRRPRQVGLEADQRQVGRWRGERRHREGNAGQGPEPGGVTGTEHGGQRRTACRWRKGARLAQLDVEQRQRHQGEGAQSEHHPPSLRGGGADGTQQQTESGPDGANQGVQTSGVTPHLGPHLFGQHHQGQPTDRDRPHPRRRLGGGEPSHTGG